ncbi:hypothetical protein CHS0354_039114 [Potamilus streckersoni]|uniref:Uncharacterized protein n=1 Tax=Potamilus streckersoni TaxID=2493646 RepID=A0AAE0TKZ3_9BIVA|nr:hypothetical protein CHS0354_039114 [Potamilus streckersoni]
MNSVNYCTCCDAGTRSGSGCNVDTYGTKCDNSCSVNCYPVPDCNCGCRVCNIVTGSCVDGCINSWYGLKCDKMCSKNCAATNETAICNRFTGKCVQGCKTGYFGDRCNFSCSSYCINSTCEQDNGKCSEGCKYGFKGDFCNDQTDAFGGDEIAGAIGGACVIAVWGIIVIVLICIVWRRRKRDFAIFNRNSALTSTTNATFHETDSLSPLNMAAGQTECICRGETIFIYPEVDIVDTSFNTCEEPDHDTLNKQLEKEECFELVRYDGGENHVDMRTGCNGRSREQESVFILKNGPSSSVT